VTQRRHEFQDKPQSCSRATAYRAVRDCREQFAPSHRDGFGLQVPRQSQLSAVIETRAGSLAKKIVDTGLY
jgi:hypothetical protein